MAIEIIDTLGQKNGGIFPLVDSNDVKGGYYQVKSIDERDNIPEPRRKIGMCCYVEDNVDGGVIYQLIGGIDNSNWQVFETSSEDIHVGDEPPTNDSIIWVDTSDIEVSNPITEDIIDEIKATFANLQEQIDSLTTKNLELETRILYLEIFGTPGNGGSDDNNSSNNTLLTCEDGNILTSEDGLLLIFEEGVN